ncbi:hypothetical protein CDL12_22960 [Handroanthus impetiginosus]|uniref:Replication factor A C-terminal domain-containing protein n=1 Tax=Handroanthus impetiginosus TaxID=429701 RepID=A0A2G9GGT3_9LAMI|nr:hypothetical protein CDL12_22960 [Handroanthus impetiginosus]
MAAEELMRIIVAIKLVVSRHYGISFGSTSSTSIVIDPQIPVAHKLQKWRVTNQDNIKEALLVIDRMIKMQQSSIQAGTKFHTVADVARAENANKFFLKLNIQIIETGQRFFYIACDNCHASYDAILNWSIDCQRCHETTVAKPRERVMVNIFDNTGSLDATAFGEEAVKIINMNATLAMEMNNAVNTPSVERMNKTLKDKKFLVRLKKTVKVYQENNQTQYTILKKRLAFTDEDSFVESSTPQKKLKQVISGVEDEADPDQGSH